MNKLEELNPRGYETDLKTDCYLLQLFDALKIFEKRSGFNLVISSGLRSRALQDALIAQGKSKASNSKHLIGAAADVVDLDGAIAKWCQLNEKILEEIGLYCERFSYTRGWVHFQILPPGSGKRFFIP